MTSTYTQIHAHTDTNTLQSKLRLQIGWRGTQEGSWWWLKWKSWTDQYCWRFSSLNSPLNCHAHSKQLKALCLCTFTTTLFFSFTSPCFLLLCLQLFSKCVIALLHLSQVPFFILFLQQQKHALHCTSQIKKGVSFCPVLPYLNRLKETWKKFGKFWHRFCINASVHLQ